MPSDSPHWPAADFRARGHQLIDWLADYWSRLQAHDPSLPVLSRSKPGDVVAPLPAAAPETPEPWDDIWADFQRHILPGVTHWQAPGFFAFFPANGSPPAVLADLLSTGLGVQGMLWITSPACTDLETRVADWTARLLGLPELFLSTSTGGGVIQSTASEAALCALVAARKRAGFPARPVVYASAQAHSSIVKAAMIAGIARGPDDRESVRFIDVDERHGIRSDAMREALTADRAAGRTPIFICATLGTTGCLGFDDVAAIAAALDQTPSSSPRPWLHIDAAFAGSACVCPEHRWMLRGVEHADSFCFNPHKWLLTSFDCSLFYVAHRRSLTDALTITPEYLRNTAPPTGSTAQPVTDYRDWQVPLGRRFRALKLWFVLRAYGAEGLRAHITRHCRLADLFASLVAADQGGRFELPVPRDHGLPLVAFRLRNPQADPAARDAANLALMHAANASGRIYLSHTVLPDRSVVLRLAVGGMHTAEADIHAAWEILSANAAR